MNLLTQLYKRSLKATRRIKMKITKNHRKVEKALNHIVYWNSNLFGYYNNNNGNKVDVKLSYNDDNTRIKVSIQDLDISNQYTKNAYINDLLLSLLLVIVAVFFSYQLLNNF